jgi:hypothetical protein
LAYLAIGDVDRAVEWIETGIAKVQSHEFDEGFYSLMNFKMNVTGDPHSRIPMRKVFQMTCACAATSLLALLAACQPPADTGADAPKGADTDFVSVGRGAPLAVDLLHVDADLTDPASLAAMMASLQAAPIVGPLKIPGPPGPDGAPVDLLNFVAASNGAAPEGIEPLQRDLFNTDDFYADRALWSDPRYFRCNSGIGIEQQRAATPGLGVETIGDDPPRTAAWGRCGVDYPREAIVSPYGFATAQAHYEALLEETRQRGGPTEHTYATVPGEWSGRYDNPVLEMFIGTWYGMFYNQIPTILSLLTEEYQTRLVQQAYHQVNTSKAQWPAQYCWPEGFMRRWHGAAVSEHEIMVTPSVVQIMTGVARNFITNIHIGREFKMDGAVPRLGADVPRWYGETIGFWDGDALITWTSNIQGWMTHSAFEHSNKMQTIEIYTPNRDVNGNFVGLKHEAVFYDPEALVEPIRIVRNLQKSSGFETGDPYVFIECVQTIFPIRGTASPVSPNTVIDFEVPDMYGRPWAQIWEKYWEQGMKKPEQEDIFSFEQ